MASVSGNAPFELDRRRFRVRFRMRFPSTRDSINRAVDAVMKIAEGWHGEEGEDGARADLEIALREALANAVIHGNDAVPHKDVSLRCYADPGRDMIIAIRDEGKGFDPEDVPDPRNEDRVYLSHGRGLFLMRELLDHIVYRKGGREVVLYKSCGAPEGS